MMKDKIYIKEFINLIVGYKKPLLIIMTISLLSLVQLSFILPKTYKTEFELNIYTKYFKNALISEVIPGMNSPQEMSQTIDSMIKEVMSDEFIDSIGTTYKIYPAHLTPHEMSKQRQFLRDQFTLFSTGGQSYRVGFMHSDPEVTFAISKLVMDKIRNYFIDSRIETIEIAKKTIFQKLESANGSKHMSDSEISTNALASKDPAVLRSEIAKMNSDISSLTLQFNAQHPRIVKIQQRKATIENWLNEIEHKNQKILTGNEAKIPDNNGEGKEDLDAPLLMTGNGEIQNTITANLYAKFNNINIALDIERKSLPSYIGVIEFPQYPTNPVFPKKRLFASVGFILGLICCFLYVFYKEVMSMDSVDRAKTMAKNLRGDFLGTLPHIDEKELMNNKPLSIEHSTDSAPSNEVLKLK